MKHQHLAFIFVNSLLLRTNVGKEKDKEKNVEMARDTRDFSRGADVAELRFIGFLNHDDVAVEGTLIDFSVLTLASFQRIL